MVQCLLELLSLIHQKSSITPVSFIYQAYELARNTFILKLRLVNVCIIYFAYHRKSKRQRVIRQEFAHLKP
jgi:hypothetical protein